MVGSFQIKQMGSLQQNRYCYFSVKWIGFWGAEIYSKTLHKCKPLRKGLYFNSSKNVRAKWLNCTTKEEKVSNRTVDQIIIFFYSFSDFTHVDL